jgi:hypothetical protein
MPQIFTNRLIINKINNYRVFNNNSNKTKEKVKFFNKNIYMNSTFLKNKKSIKETKW